MDNFQEQVNVPFTPLLAKPEQVDVLLPHYSHFVLDGESTLFGDLHEFGQTRNEPTHCLVDCCVM